MLARLSRNAARLLELRFEASDDSSSIPEDEDTLSLDIDAQALRALIIPLPNLAWQRFSGICGQLAPMYESIQNMLANDVEHLAKLLLELEPLTEEDLHAASEIDEDAKASLCSCCMGDNLTCHITPTLEDNANQERPLRKRRRSSSPSDLPLIIPSAHPSIPTVIVTPCLSQPHETSCLVPCQDAAFGNKLVVPLHPVSNKLFPPQLSSQPLPQMERWRYVDGHWWAVLPNLEEQHKKGIFSRAFVVKKRACRLPCSRTAASRAPP